MSVRPEQRPCYKYRNDKKHKKIINSCVIKELKIKTRHYYTPIKKIKIQNTDKTKYVQSYGTIGALIYGWQVYRMAQPYRNMVGLFCIKHAFTIGSRNCASWDLPKGIENI